MAYKYLLLGLVLFCILQKGYGMHCFQCSSANSPFCQDAFDCSKIDVDNCDYGCLKHEFVDRSDYTTGVVRMCASMDYCSQKKSDMDIHCSVCYSDLCNSAILKSGSFTVLILSVIVSTLTFRN